MKRINRRGLLKLSAAAAAGAGVAARRARARGAGSPPKAIILSCDGGGIRGLISALLLQGLDPAFLNKVALFAGTSTGSIIALGLAAGVSIADLVALYGATANCQAIFTPYVPTAEVDAVRAELRAALAALPSPSAAPQIDWRKILELVVKAVAELAYPKYQSAGLKALLEQHLPSLTLAQLASGKFVVVPSFQINGAGAEDGWRPVLFHNLPGLPVTPELSDTTLVDTAMCSAAAPLYFPPHQLGVGAFVDGGLAANNPCSAAIAAVLASSLGRQSGFTAADIAAVSISTGAVANTYPPADAAFPFGILGWLWPYPDPPAPSFPLLQGMFAGTSGADDQIARMVLRDSTYIRVDPVFEATWSLDDCSAIGPMTDATQAYMRTDKWKDMAARINALAG